MRVALISVFIFVGISFFFGVVPVDAAGLIPCGGNEEPPCQACHVVQLGQNLLSWFIKTMAAVIAVVFAWGGLKMVMSGGSTEGVSEAKGMMTNAVIGFIILLGAWLIVDTVLKTVMKEGTIGPWNEIACVAQPVYTKLPEGQGRPTVGGGTATDLTPTQSASDIQSRIDATNSYRSDLCKQAVKSGVPDDCDALQAIMAIESHGNPNAQSPYAAGLMQVAPATARGMYPSILGKMDDVQVGEWLKVPANGMKAGVDYYKQLKDQYGNDEVKIFAAYNGGPGANRQSQNCDGKLMWECAWDDDAHTVPDMADGKGYAETRKYVPNVIAVKTKLKK